MKYLKKININFDNWDSYSEDIDYPQHVDKKIYKRFIKFLNDNNIYDEYFDRLNKMDNGYYNIRLYKGENFFFDIEPSDWLYKSFSWAGDFDKWDKLDIKWGDILDKNK